MAGGGINQYDRGYGWVQISVATLIKPAAGRMATVSFLSTTGGPVSCYDAATLASANSSNMFFTSNSEPQGAVVVLDWPCMVGMVVQTGGATVAVSFS